MSNCTKKDFGEPPAGRGPIPPIAGIGLRFQHHQAVVDDAPAVGWMEVHTENYLGGGTPLRFLHRIRADYPISMHGVGLSLGSAEGLDSTHLDRVADAVSRIEPILVSEHLSWSRVAGLYIPDLLPLPLTEESLQVVCRNIDTLQSRLKRKILLENPSSYFQFAHSTIPEWEFMAAVAEHTGCGILCDVNNIYVSAHNHGWDAQAYLAALHPNTIGEIHLAGHSLKHLNDGSILRLDDHGSRVNAGVWELYRHALERFGPKSTLIEWDNNVPALEVLVEEARQANQYLQSIPMGNEHADVA